MPKVLYEDSNFKILKGRDYILVRKDYPYNYHAHFKEERGAHLVINLFNKQMVPREPYFIESMRRITTEGEFASFTEQRVKPRYRNNNRGRR